MEKLLIIQTGTTFDAIRTKHGDFDQFIIQQIQHLPVQIEVLSVYQEPTTLPDPADLNGVIITGSHSMVSDTSLGVNGWQPGSSRAVSTPCPFSVSAMATN